MQALGFIVFLCLVYPVKNAKLQTNPDLHVDNVVYVAEGENVTINCFYYSDIAMHFSWYKHTVGQKPQLISTIYKYDTKPMFYHEFKDNPRFNMSDGQGKAHLVIQNLKLSDSASYYCGSAHSNIVEFGEGTELIVQASKFGSVSVFQQPVFKILTPGDSVTLHCKVQTEGAAGKYSVYWLKDASGISFRNYLLYMHKDSSDQCKDNSKTGSSTQSCSYSILKRNLSTSDSGTYYCAVAACGVVHFGNGTTLGLNYKDLGCFEHLQVLVLLSVSRAFVLLCCAAIIIVIFCAKSKKC